MRGHFKGQPAGKVTAVYRKRFCIYVEKLQREKGNGTNVPVAIHPSNVSNIRKTKAIASKPGAYPVPVGFGFQVMIVRLKMDSDRKKILDRRTKGRLAKLEQKKGKYSKGTAMELDGWGISLLSLHLSWIKLSKSCTQRINLPLHLFQIPSWVYYWEKLRLSKIYKVRSSNAKCLS